METIGERLNFVRIELGKTYEDIALLLDFTSDGIRVAIKRNKVKVVYVNEICKKLNISKEWLKEGVGEMLLPNHENKVKDYLQEAEEVQTFRENDYKDDIIMLLKEKVENLKIEIEILKKIKKPIKLIIGLCVCE